MSQYYISYKTIDVKESFQEPKVWKIKTYYNNPILVEFMLALWETYYVGFQ